MTYLFAQELNEQGRYLLCVDAYEALVSSPQLGRASWSDVWLRDLVWQLDRGLVVLAGREPPGWQRHHPQWAERIHEVTVDGLPLDARIELLEALGVNTPQQARALAEESAGLPYYLRLAREVGSGAGAFPQLEERFLHMVEPEVVRLLELLSVARVFDRTAFTSLATHIGMRADVLMWETLIGYSFVSTAGTDTLQLHQLMAQAVRARLSARMQHELHQVLHEMWRDRASATESPRAWQEAAYHGSRMAAPSMDVLVECGEQMARLEGQAGLQASLADLPERPELPRLRMLWQAESALLVGDAAAAAAATSARVELAPGADEVDARLAVAAAHARRIAGNTHEALVRYGRVWSAYQGPVALGAGAWFADLQMAQGRFADAISVASQVAGRCPSERQALLGDLARLTFLAHRFLFDSDTAVSHLERARAHYRAAGHVVGLANAATNTVELSAVTDPEAAIATAAEAIAAQQHLGAEHELGKTYTALALAHLRLGELDQSRHALDEAVAVLDRCGYRSACHRRLSRRHPAGSLGASVPRGPPTDRRVVRFLPPQRARR